MKYKKIAAGAVIIGLGIGLVAYDKPVEPVKQDNAVVEQAEVEQEPRKAVERSEETEKVDVVAENPNDCDQETQWIWEDGTCHDKEAPAEPKREEPRTTRQGYPADCEVYRRYVEHYPDWDVGTMMRIMEAESGCNPTNHNWDDQHATCEGSFGLFQIGCVHGYGPSYLRNPGANVKVAYQIWLQQGYGAWTTY